MHISIIIVTKTLKAKILILLIYFQKKYTNIPEFISGYKSKNYT